MNEEEISQIKNLDLNAFGKMMNFPLIKSIMPSLAASDLVSVQPSGKSLTVRFVYPGGKSFPPKKEKKITDPILILMKKIGYEV
jgi:hypothetical protein